MARPHRWLGTAVNHPCRLWPVGSGSQTSGKHKQEEELEDGHTKGEARLPNRRRESTGTVLVPNCPSRAAQRSQLVLRIHGYLVDLVVGLHGKGGARSRQRKKGG